MQKDLPTFSVQIPGRFLDDLALLAIIRSTFCFSHSFLPFLYDDTKYVVLHQIVPNYMFVGSI